MSGSIDFLLFLESCLSHDTITSDFASCTNKIFFFAVTSSAIGSASFTAEPTGRLDPADPVGTGDAVLRGFGLFEVLPAVEDVDDPPPKKRLVLMPHILLLLLEAGLRTGDAMRGRDSALLLPFAVSSEGGLGVAGMIFTSRKRLPRMSYGAPV